MSRYVNFKLESEKMKGESTGLATAGRSNPSRRHITRHKEAARSLMSLIMVFLLALK